MNKIQLEVIPDKCIGRNLHSHDIISKERWIDISQRIRSRGRCQYCERMFESEELNAHEIWEFDGENRIQKLMEIVCVCKKCHMTIHYHFLLSSKSLEDRDAFICKANYMDVNFCYEKDFEKDLNEVLRAYRSLNQIIGDWSMDISYVLREGFLVYEDINMENLERTAPESAKFLESFKTSARIKFNGIPLESLIDRAVVQGVRDGEENCEICGSASSYLYKFYDLRIKNNSKEMRLVGTKKICSLCRQTIYYGATKSFMRFRETTKHYMKLNNCSYEECKHDAKEARKSMQIGSNNLCVYLKTPPLKGYDFTMRNRYLSRHGAKFDSKMSRWYLSPVLNLRFFKDYL